MPDPYTAITVYAGMDADHALLPYSLLRVSLDRSASINQATFADYFVLGTGRSAAHLAMLASAAGEALSAHDCEVLGHKRAKKGSAERQPEGLPSPGGSSDWVAVDLGGVVAHFFSGDARRYYAMESLWTQESGDAEPWRLSPRYDAAMGSEEGGEEGGARTPLAPLGRLPPHLRELAADVDSTSLDDDGTEASDHNRDLERTGE